MLVIRRAQLDSLSEVALLRFEDALLAHFCTHLPGHVALLGEEGAREAIRHGVARARDHGIVSEDGVAIYVRHMFLFGRDFDVDPGLPWAAAALAAPESGEEAGRVQRLAAAAMAYLHGLLDAEAAPA